jgi:hypothetical protein
MPLPKVRTAAKPVAREGSRSEMKLTPVSIVRRQAPTPTHVFDTYWRFAVERQNVLFRRLEGRIAPWTPDPILATFKFTNAYRAADRVSQYLIRNVIYARDNDPADVFLRVLLFKLFNKIETWELIEHTHGSVSAKTFDVDRIDRTLNSALAGGASIYSAAYIMPSGPAEIRQPRKHRMHLELINSAMRTGLATRVASAKSMAELYELLLAMPSIGPFLAYQFATDLNYGPFVNFSEMDFVVPGPGAYDGIKKCFSSLGDYSAPEAIRWVADRQEEEFKKRDLRFKSLWGRPLQLIDCQNLFCEVDKYSRVAHPEVLGYSGRTRIKQKFQAKSESIDMWFPPKWQINDRILAAGYPRVGTSFL